MSAYASDAIQQALEEGCTTKTRALAQAYRSLRVARHYTTRETLDAIWAVMEREGSIVREGREYRMREEVQNDDK
jgi:hypothetical protein